jgi:hypothetical protein
MPAREEVAVVQVAKLQTQAAAVQELRVKAMQGATLKHLSLTAEVVVVVVQVLLVHLEQKILRLAATAAPDYLAVLPAWKYFTPEEGEAQALVKTTALVVKVVVDKADAQMVLLPF